MGLNQMNLILFFNFRATQFIVENGLSEYFQWHANMSWYTEGRNVSGSSQVMLHITTAVTYQLFGDDFSLYDFTILFPVVVGLLTVVIIFALTGSYVSSAFVRLELFASISIIILSSIGLSILTREIMHYKKLIYPIQGNMLKISFSMVIIILIVIPLTFPANGNWITSINTPPTILNGGPTYSVSTND